MDQAGKTRLLERLGAYLDSVPAEPSAQTPTEAPDLFTLLAELAALKNEVKLESRQVRDALEQFRGLLDRLSAANAQLEAELGRRREEEGARLAQAQQGLLLDLLDLRDRLAAGRAQAQRYRPGWLARRSGAADFVVALGEGQGLSLARLDEILERRGVRPLAALGRPFDTHRMHAAGTAWNPDQAAGTVLEEIRTGYLRDEELLRPAEVMVNKPERDA
jgi:molecular chaperone GrpE